MPRETMPKGADVHCHHKGKGVMLLVLGLLVFGNAYYSVLSWGMFVGLVMIIAGLVKLFKPKK